MKFSTTFTLATLALLSIGTQARIGGGQHRQLGSTTGNPVEDECNTIAWNWCVTHLDGEGGDAARACLNYNKYQNDTCPVPHDWRDHRSLERGLRSLEDTDPGIQHDCSTTHQDPWASGGYVPCCAGLTEEQYKGDKKTICLHMSKPCTPTDQDPWATGSYRPCCAGLEEKQNPGDERTFCLNVSDAIP